MEKLTKFQSWFRTFLEEKQVDMSEVLVNNGSKFIQVGDVCRAIFNTDSSEQAQIKHTLVMIDFKNGDVVHYFKHLSQAL